MLVLGKGGAGRAVALAFENLGVEPLILSRNDPEWDRVQSIAEQYQFIINATGSEDLPIQWDRIPLDTIAIDLRYYPKPKFLKEAERFGHLAVTGLQMLLYQGSRSFELWTGQPPPLEVMEGALMHTVRKFAGEGGELIISAHKKD
ncbi:MAG TPA: hypothetical protein VJL87_01145 [Bdellovibrionota bacterium]|nr:hypothetical protein [Bdellovibrionota bacterium]